MKSHALAAQPQKHQRCFVNKNPGVQNSRQTIVHVLYGNCGFPPEGTIAVWQAAPQWQCNWVVLQPRCTCGQQQKPVELPLHMRFRPVTPSAHLACVVLGGRKEVKLIGHVRKVPQLCRLGSQ